MISKIKQFIAILSFIKLMGFKWFCFRLNYEYLKRTQYFNKKNKIILHKVSQLKLKSQNFNSFDIINKSYKSNSTTEKADNALLGKIYAFSNQYFNYSTHNNEINWHLNPVNNKIAPSNKSWNGLPDFGAYGDIKCIWEASRFPQIFYFIDAFSITKNEKYAYGCINQILDWIKNNPYPQGVNYKCGQEIAFRLFAWIIACDYFSEFISEKNWLIIRKTIYTCLLRINLNIDFAAKSIRNNHSISEAVGLLVGGILFSEFPESQHFKEKGLLYLTNELQYQIYDDGTYIQHSFNYQRLAIDIISFAIVVMKNKKIPIPKDILNGHKKLYTCLNSFIQKNGYLPNYGSNDGAYLFPIGSYNYRDYRESLNFASVSNQDLTLFESNKTIIHLFKLNLQKKQIHLRKKISFKTGGYYILKNDSIFIFIRCPSYIDRPAQNDVFHTDIWINNRNIFTDAGSYSYNTDKELKKEFTGMKGHNTCVIQDSDPMKQILNFGYLNWVKSTIIKLSKTEIICQHNGYKKKFGITHQRQITLKEKEIIVIDEFINNKKPIEVSQIWNTIYPIKVNNKHIEIDNNIILSSNHTIKTINFSYSENYNSYTKNDKIFIQEKLYKHDIIKTHIKIK